MCSVAAPKVDLLRATATDLQQLMHDGKLTSVDLVKQILDQIEGHNEAGVGIRAMLAVAPRELLIDRANALDEERNGGSTRGPLHGIPIIVKDCFNTDASTGLNTTVGSFAFANAKAKNGRVISKLLERGLIIIGKTNLNEFCNWKGIDQWNGWSAVGGQTNSAYFEGGLQRNDGKMGHSNPCGSSTGSAVGVSAGFSPIGLGTETDGSLVQPGARAALYTLKPTPGTTDLDGVWMVSADFDAVGAMTKSTADLALITELVLNQKAREALPDGGFQGFLHTDFDGVKVGFLDPAIWRWPPHIQKQEEGTLEQIHSAYHNAIDTIQKNGGKTVYPVTIPLVEDLQYEGELASNKAMFHSFQHNVEQYMKSLEQSDVRTLKELVAFINQHAQNELPPEHPEQGKLKRALENATSEAIYEACMEHCATVVKGGLDRALAEYDVDLIAMPMDCPIPSVASCARYPIASMPLGMLDYNGRPFGLAIIGRAGEEGLMFKFMSAFESVFPSRSVPRRLDEWQRSRASL